MKEIAFTIIISLSLSISCTKDEFPQDNSILGYDILNDLNGHWVGTNQTPFGYFEWFAFDFRPISSSHTHSIYEGATNQNIITSVFVAEYEGRHQIMARNGGWLGNQYRATYFLLDKAENREDSKYYRLVDAIGGENRAYLEFRFVNDSIYIDAYKDDGGTLDKPIHHMGFAGVNRNPSYSNDSKELFKYPKPIAEVDLNGKFKDLVDNDSALFLDEITDPFPKSKHGHLSDLSIDISRNSQSEDHRLLLYFSMGAIVDNNGIVDLSNLDDTVIRTISIESTEQNYLATYLHPDDYYLTIFSDFDNNNIPSPGDYSSVSKLKTINVEASETVEINLTTLVK